MIVQEEAPLGLNQYFPCPVSVAEQNHKSYVQSLRTIPEWRNSITPSLTLAAFVPCMKSPLRICSERPASFNSHEVSREGQLLI